ncbi:hypothetical protein D9619_005046 [Psilocybe cf. subviscida]|uniref:Uncharacterized protein n=1 Tax=Psilocybe cf. subviscida TaxID=2480587 RepID=A0A8H5BPE4_9AGAR|nr:hypothetical protein D9619_005046 [Psilocybe cf. subviscida]
MWDARSTPNVLGRAESTRTPRSSIQSCVTPRNKPFSSQAFTLPILNRPVRRPIHNCAFIAARSPNETFKSTTIASECSNTYRAPQPTIPCQVIASAAPVSVAVDPRHAIMIGSAGNTENPHLQTCYHVVWMRAGRERESLHSDAATARKNENLDAGRNRLADEQTIKLHRTGLSSFSATKHHRDALPEVDEWVDDEKPAIRSKRGRNGSPVRPLIKRIRTHEREGMMRL